MEKTPCARNLVSPFDGSDDLVPILSKLDGLDHDRDRPSAWVVFGYMQTKDAVSPNVSAGSILFSIITFSTIYAILAIVLIYLFIREIKKGPDGHEEVEENVSVDPFDKGGEKLVTE